jgi:hypothetical protein
VSCVVAKACERSTITRIFLITCAAPRTTSSLQKAVRSSVPGRRERRWGHRAGCQGYVRLIGWPIRHGGVSEPTQYGQGVCRPRWPRYQGACGQMCVCCCALGVLLWRAVRSSGRSAARIANPPTIQLCVHGALVHHRARPLAPPWPLIWRARCV